MFSERTREYLSTLVYRADAKRHVCWLPLGGIYWDDEMPDIPHLMKIPESDRNQILRLFHIRARIWNGEMLPDEDRQFWDVAQSLVPAWAFFQRQQVSADDQQAQEKAGRETTEGLDALFADADEVRISEKDGIQSLTLTFDLTKDQRAGLKKRSWWKRIFRRGHPDKHEL